MLYVISMIFDEHIVPSNAPSTPTPMWNEYTMWQENRKLMAAEEKKLEREEEIIREFHTLNRLHMDGALPLPQGYRPRRSMSPPCPYHTISRVCPPDRKS